MTLQTHAPENFRSRRWGPSRGSRVRRPGSEDPISVSGNFNIKFTIHNKSGVTSCIVDISNTIGYDTTGVTLCQDKLVYPEDFFLLGLGGVLDLSMFNWQ